MRLPAFASHAAALAPADRTAFVAQDELASAEAPDEDEDEDEDEEGEREDEDDSQGDDDESPSSGRDAGDWYDLDDGFIDDSELFDTQEDDGKAKHNGFFINKARCRCQSLCLVAQRLTSPFRRARLSESTALRRPRLTILRSTPPRNASGRLRRYAFLKTGCAKRGQRGSLTLCGFRPMGLHVCFLAQRRCAL